jgi:acetyltransferase-like isoleucine patch superfamily enzyme
MLNFSSWLYRIGLKIKFGERLKIAPGVSIPWSTVFIIDQDSIIEIASGVIIRDFVELRSTRNSALLLSSAVKLDRSVRIIATNNKTISIGVRCRIGLGTVFNGGGNISIGEKTLVSGYVYLQTSMHDHKKDSDIIDSGYSYGDISIGKGSWIGAHAVIFPSVELGERVIVGSNAVVNQSFKSASVVGGIPAKELK